MICGGGEFPPFAPPPLPFHSKETEVSLAEHLPEGLHPLVYLTQRYLDGMKEAGANNPYEYYPETANELLGALANVVCVKTTNHQPVPGNVSVILDRVVAWIYDHGIEMGEGFVDYVLTQAEQPGFTLEETDAEIFQAQVALDHTNFEELINLFKAE